MPKKRILLTAFEPFGGETINPTQEIIRAMLKNEHPDAEIHTLFVPVSFADAAQTVLAALYMRPCDAVLMLGQAGGRRDVTVERVAINLDDARIPDNDGDQPSDRTIILTAPAAYFATIPVKAVVEAIQMAGVPASVSNSAGTFVCNNLMFQVLHHLRQTGIPAGFIHVPYLPEQVSDKPGAPSMPLADMVKAIEAAVKVLS